MITQGKCTEPVGRDVTYVATNNNVMPTTIKTVDRNLIKAFAEARQGDPAMVDQKQDGYNSQPLRFQFKDHDNQGDFDLKPVTWKVFFTQMDNRELALAYEEDGDDPYFYEFVPHNA